MGGVAACGGVLQETVIVIVMVIVIVIAIAIVIINDALCLKAISVMDKMVVSEGQEGQGWGLRTGCNYK